MAKGNGNGYREIRVFYEHLIRTGQLSPGAMLPTEAELAKKHQVTRTTLRRAFEGLVNKGLVVKVQGRGSFVAEAADVESRARSHVIIAAPQTQSSTPADGIHTEDARYHDGLYQYLESFILAIAGYGRPFRIFYYTDTDERLDALCAAARRNGDLGILIFDVEQEKTVDRLMACDVPVVFVDSAMHGRQADLVRSASFDGARRATQHLLETTPGPLAFVGGRSGRDEGSPHKDRLDGFIAAHREIGREVGDELIHLDSVMSRGGRRAVQKMLQLPTPPTGYVCSDDDFACGVLEELRERGVAVPAQVSVIGFGNSLYSRTVIPNLSTLAVDRRTMGLKAVDLLHARLDNPKAPPAVATVPVQLVLRQTTIVAPPPAR